MTYKEAMKQIDRLRSLIEAGGDDSVFTEADRALIEELYASECNKQVRQCNCRDRYTDAVIEIHLTLKRKKTMANEQKYQLRAGVIIWIGTEAYSRHNLTDEIAAAYLKMHPEDRRKFERVPAEAQSPSVKRLIKKAAETNAEEAAE